jgi:hypothetical protein
VWIIYTHFPVITKYDFDASRVVMGVRCPFDVIDSFFNLTMTRTHDKTLLDSEYDKYKDLFERFVKEHVQGWKMFYEHWLSKDVPTYIVRYEDLNTEPRNKLTNVFSFLLKTPHYENS